MKPTSFGIQNQESAIFQIPYWSDTHPGNNRDTIATPYKFKPETPSLKPNFRNPELRIRNLLQPFIGCRTIVFHFLGSARRMSLK
jgi:hypothetical protein